METQRVERAMLWRILASIAGFALTGVAWAYPVLTIDSMQTPQTLHRVNQGQPLYWSTSGSGILGGEREILATNYAPQMFNQWMEVGVTPDQYFVIRQGDEGDGYVELVWDGPDDSPTLDPRGLGGIDLTRGGQLQLLYLLAPANDVAMDMQIEVFTDSGNASRYTALFGTRKRGIPFTAFAPFLGAGATFTNVGAIRIKFGRHAGYAAHQLMRLWSFIDLTVTEMPWLQVDALDPGVANPGDVIRYTWIIANTYDLVGATHTDVVVDSGLDPQTTLIPGSVSVAYGPATVIQGNGAQDTAVRVRVPSLADEQFTTIRFDVRVNSSIDPATAQLSSQATYRSNSLPIPLLGDSNVTGNAAEGPPVPTVVPASSRELFADGFEPR